MVSNLANTIAFFIFTSVNVAVVYKYHKEKREKQEQNGDSNRNSQEKEELEPLLQKFKNAYPSYAILGTICTAVLFFNSPKFYKIN